MEKIEVLISCEELEQRVKELGKEITDFYANRDIYAVCVLKGGVIFMIDLLKHVDAPYEMSFMSVSSYGASTESSGHIKVNLDIDQDLTGKNVLFVEDIVDSGRTVDYLVRQAIERNAADVKVCTLLYKPERTTFDVKMDFIGFTIPDKFVIGYGLDFNQKYRDLKYIGVLKFEE